MLDEGSLIQYRSQLNSDIIKATFGSYGVQILFQDPEVRISNLYSGEQIMRTCATVHYALPIPEPLIAVHEEIYKGASIGATLKKHGFNLVKKPIYFGEIVLTESLKKAMHVHAEAVGSIHAYALYAGNLTYCTILEIHSPLYLNAHGLNVLYPNEYHLHTTITPEVEHLLTRIKNLDVADVNPSAVHCVLFNQDQPKESAESTFHPRRPT